jgi:hypothetical protein
MATKKAATAKKETAKGKGKKTTEKKAPAKAAEKKAPAKGKGKKAAEEAPKKRGRQAGVSYIVKDQYKETISNVYESIEDNLASAADELNVFVEENKKSAVGIARKKLMEIIHQCKALRNELQSAKTDMEMVKK